jgi:hypothetical protein
MLCRMFVFNEKKEIYELKRVLVYVPRSFNGHSTREAARLIISTQHVVYNYAHVYIMYTDWESEKRAAVTTLSHTDTKFMKSSDRPGM